MAKFLEQGAITPDGILQYVSCKNLGNTFNTVNKFDTVLIKTTGFRDTTLWKF